MTFDPISLVEAEYEGVNEAWLNNNLIIESSSLLADLLADLSPTIKDIHPPRSAFRNFPDSCFLFLSN